IGEVLARIDASETARAEDRVGDRSALAAGVGPREEEVLARQGRADVQPLDEAVVQRQEAVVEKARERDLVGGEGAERDAELGRGRLVLLAQRAPLRELVPDWLAARSPRGELGVVVELANLVLDLVEPLVRRERERCALVAGVERLHEIPSGVHVAT